MNTRGYRPLDPELSSEFMPKFDESYWLPEGKSAENLPYVFTSPDTESSGVAVRLYARDRQSRVREIAEMHEGSQVVAAALNPGVLVRSVYEAVRILKKTKRRVALPPSAVTCYVRDWPEGGFNIYAQTNDYKAIYAQRLAIHCIYTHTKGYRMLCREGFKADIADGSFVGKEQISLFSKANINAGMPMLGSWCGVTDWRMGQTYDLKRRGKRPLSRERSYLRIMESRVLEPDSTRHTPKQPKKRETFILKPALGARPGYSF